MPLLRKLRDALRRWPLMAEELAARKESELRRARVLDDPATDDARAGVATRSRDPMPPW